MDVFIRRGIDPMHDIEIGAIWLHQEGLWEYMDDGAEEEQQPWADPRSTQSRIHGV